MYGHQFMGNGFFMPGFFFWIITLGIIFFIFNSIFDRKNKAKDSNEEALIIAKKIMPSNVVDSFPRKLPNCGNLFYNWNISFLHYCLMQGEI